MKKINDYIKYLLTLILLEGIKVFAQTTGNLSQISSQANQELSNLYPSNSSFINTTSFSEIIKQNIDKLGYYFINYAIPFLFVFGILTYLTYESKKELSRPLILIYLIIAFLATEFFHAVIIILALIFVLILIFFGIHKIFHGITGSIIGSIIVILLAYIVLTNSGSIMGFLPSSAFYILLLILFIIIFIYGYKLSQSSDIKKLKKLIYHIHTPQDAIKLKNDLGSMVGQFRQDIIQLKNDFRNLISTLQNNYLNQQRPPRNIDPLIRLLRKIRDNINAFIKEYENYKRDLDVLEADINRRHKEPLRSYLLKTLEKEGKEEIEREARAAFQEYQQIYQRILRSNRYNIINLARSGKYKRTINNIFNDIESILHSFNI